MVQVHLGPPRTSLLAVAGRTPLLRALVVGAVVAGAAAALRRPSSARDGDGTSPSAWAEATDRV